MSTNGEKEVEDVGLDPFNLDALRLPPAFEQQAGVKNVISNVPVRKPNQQEWFRVHPSEDYRGNFGTILLKEEGEHYLIVPALMETLRDEMTSVTLYTVMNRNSSSPFLWPVKLPGGNRSSRRTDAWITSAHEAAAAAMKRSVRMRADMSLGAYAYAFSDSPTPENDPVWPDLPFSELVRIAFAKTGCLVTSYEHPVLKMLRGE